MADVIEQGATRRLRPSDFYGPAKHFDRKVPSKYRRKERKTPVKPAKPKPGQPGYTPRNPRNPGWVPPRQRPKTPKPVVHKPNIPVPAAPVPAGAAGRVAKRLLPRFLPGLGWALTAYDLYNLLDSVDWYWRPGLPEPNPANGWYLVSECPGRVPDTGMAWAIQPHQACIANQAMTKLRDGLGNISPPRTGDIYWSLWRWNGDHVIARGDHVKSWERWWGNAQKAQEPLLLPGGAPMFFPRPAPWGNPNIRKDVPSPHPTPASDPKADPFADPSASPRTKTDTATSPMEKIEAGERTLSDTSWQVSVDVGPRPARPLPPPLPHRRRRPDKRTRERKAKGSVYYFFAAADAVSEGAEVIDAAFEALPEDVQKRWSRGRRPGSPLDNMGQYGIDGADWKAQAVFHNLHKLDVKEFFRNVLSNQAEDALIGGLHRNLPDNFINANEGGQKAYAKLVQELLAGVGL